MIKHKKTVLFLLLLASICATAWAADLPTIPVSAEQARASGITTEPVTLTKAGEPVGEGLRLPGVAVFPNKAVQMISAPAAGVVEQILVDPMENVAAGAPLLVLRSPQILEWQREYVQASLQASLAGAKLRRDEELYKEGIIAESRLQESRGAFAQSDAARNALRQTLKIAGMSDKAIAALGASHALSATLSISSPQRGIVIEQLASIGQRVDAGAPLAKVAQQDKLWVELQATRQQGALIRPGDAVRIEACEQAGKVAALSPQLTAASQTVAIRVVLPAAASCVRPNQHVEGIVKVRGTGAAALVVQSAALAGNGGKSYVFVRDKSGFRVVEVTVDLRDKATASVRGALHAGDEVAVQGVSTLKGMWLGLGAAANEGK